MQFTTIIKLYINSLSIYQLLSVFTGITNIISTLVEGRGDGESRMRSGGQRL